MQSVCFPLHILADDRMRVLTKPEKLDFALAFCPLAAMNRRLPGVIPPMTVATLGRKLGLAAKIVIKRLERFSSPDVELIDLEYDSPECEGAVPGALNRLSTVHVEILDFAEWNGLDEEDEGEAFTGVERRGQANTDEQNGNDGHGMESVAPSVNARRQKRHRQRKELRKEIAELDAMIQNTINPNALARLCADRESALAELFGLLDARKGFDAEISLNGASADLGVTQNGNSNASEDQSNAEALQNGQNSVTRNGSQAPQNGENGSANGENSVTDALRPSRLRKTNVQRSPSDSFLDSKKDITLNVTDDKRVTLPVTPKPPSLAPKTSSRPQASHRPQTSTRPHNGRAQPLVTQAVALAQELRDIGSVDRHYQLLAIADQHQLESAITEALGATRKKMQSANEPNKPGAYFQKIVLAKFSDHGIHVPTKAELEAEPPDEIKQMIQQSMASVTPLEDLYGDNEGADDDQQGDYVP